MSFPTKDTRQKCWDARDRYWNCLDANEDEGSKCSKFREDYESSCPAQWIKHFDRKRDYLKFKAQIEQEGIESSSTEAGESTKPNSSDNKVSIEPVKKQQRFFKQPKICDVCRNCDTNVDFCAQLLEESSSLLLNVLSRRILSLEQQIIATKAFHSISSCFGKSPEFWSDFLVQLSFINENNKIFNDKSSTQGVRKITFKNHDEISLFKLCFYYHFSNFFKETMFFNLFVDKEGSAIFCEILDFCRVQNYLTSLAFKVLINFLSNLIRHEKIDFINDSLSIKVLNLVLANWENAISGVKESNLLVFRLFLQIRKDESFLFILTSIVYEELSWHMKSKYFMLLELLRINESLTSTAIEKKFPLLIPKLLESMKINNLVSASTELYQLIISRITFEDWQNLFLPPLLNTLEDDGNELQKSNILNHWMLSTLKNYPKSLLTILDKLSEKETNEEVSSTILYSIISCLKILRKQGIEGYKALDDFEKWMDLLEIGLKHFDERIRIEAFSLICCCTKTTIPPSRSEYFLVFQFLFENVNADSSFLRQNLLTSFTVFLDRIKKWTESKSKKKKQEIGTESELNSLNWFFSTLADFFVQNLAPDSNYQRQITTLKLLKITSEFCFNLKSFHGISQKFTRECVIKKLFSCVFRETDDVNKTAAEILTLYIQRGVVLDLPYSIDDSLKLCNHPVFYTSTSGFVSLKICFIHEVEKMKSNSKNSLTDLHEFSQSILSRLLELAVEQNSIITQDLLKAASEGSLYGLLRGIIGLISDKEISKFINHLGEFLQQLLVLMENTVHYLLKCLTLQKTNPQNTAPSFAEMGLAIESQIEGSDFYKTLLSDEGNKDDVHLSSAHQLLLNCIWHNLQVCCDTAVNLLISFHQVLTESETVRIGSLISDVLFNCRHKGAIEAAGVSFGRFINWAIKSNNECLLNWIEKLVDKVFEVLTIENHGAISRRSAGLSILIHRLAVNDTRTYKSIVEKVVPGLLKIASVPYLDSDLVLTDVPQAHALHLLCKLVEDSSLCSSIAPFLNEIFLVLCSSMDSLAWGIRNAAYQLCGATILKILGRKKTQEVECIVNLTFEQLFSHHEYLKEIFLKSFEMKHNANEDKIIFLLTILSYTSIQTDSKLIKTVEEQNFLETLRNHIQQYFDHRNYEVRKLAAVSYINLFPTTKYITVAKNAVKVICEALEIEMDFEQSCIEGNKQSFEQERHELATNLNENLLQGHLLVIRFAIVKFKKEYSSYSTAFSFFGIVYESMISSSDRCQKMNMPEVSETAPTKFKSVSYILKTLVYEICQELDFTCCKEKRTSQFQESDFRSLTKLVRIDFRNEVENVGLTSFTEILLKHLIARHESHHFRNVFWFCVMNYGFNLIDICLNEMCHDKSSAGDMVTRCFKFVSIGFFENDAESRIINLAVIEFIIKIFDSYGNNLKDSVQISLESIENFAANFIGIDREFTHKALLVALGLLYLLQPQNEMKILEFKSSSAYSQVYMKLMTFIPRLLCDHDEKIRMNVAKTLFYLSKFLFISNEAILIIWQPLIYLLQDEIFAVRLEASKVVSSILKKSYVLNPYVALIELINPIVMLKIMEPCDIVKNYWLYLSIDNDLSSSLTGSTPMVLPSRMKDSQSDLVFNPFNHVCSNFYAEDSMVLTLIFVHSLIILEENKSELSCYDSTYDLEMTRFLLNWQKHSTQSPQQFELIKREMHCYGRSLQESAEKNEDLSNQFLKKHPLIDVDHPRRYLLILKKKFSNILRKCLQEPS